MTVKIIALAANPEKFSTKAILFRTDLKQFFLNKGTYATPDFKEIVEISVVGKHDAFIHAGMMWARITDGADGLTRVETTTNKVNYQSWEFDSVTQQYVQFQWVPPRNWDHGTMKATFWWTNAAGLTTETVDFAIAGIAISNDDALDVAMGTAIVVTDTWIAQGDVHISPQSSAITIAGSPVDSDLVQFEIYRKVSTDNLTGDARLLACVLEYSIDAGVSA